MVFFQQNGTIRLLKFNKKSVIMTIAVNGLKKNYIINEYVKIKS